MKSIEEAVGCFAFLQLRIAITLQSFGVARAEGVSKKLVGFFYLQLVHFGVVEVARLSRAFNYEAFWKAMSGSFAYKKEDAVRSEIATQLWMASYRSYKNAETYLAQGDALNAIKTAQNALMYYPGAVSSQEIIEEAKKMLRNPDRLEALRLAKQARALMKTQPDEALVSLEKAIALYPAFQGIRRLHSELSLKQANAVLAVFDYEGSLRFLEKAILHASKLDKVQDRDLASELQRLKSTTLGLIMRRDKANQLLAEAKEVSTPPGDALVKALLSQRISPIGGSVQDELILRLTACHQYPPDVIVRAHFSVEMCIAYSY